MGHVARVQHHVGARIHRVYRGNGVAQIGSRVEPLVCQSAPLLDMRIGDLH